MSSPLVRLGEALRARGYQFTTVTPVTHTRVNVRLENAWARDLAGVFGWSRPFRRETVGEELFALMEAAQVLIPHGEGWLSAVRCSTLASQLFFHSRFPTREADAVFFGPDTYRFAQAIELHLQSQSMLRRAVDIGCGAGPGAVLLALARPRAEVLALDINPQALAFCAVNAELAGCSQRLMVGESNLLRDVGGQFDLIVSNPPYMLDSAQRAYRHGGGDLGAALSLAIVDAALPRLNPGGSLLLYTGIAIGNGHDPFLAYCQERLADEQCRWSYRELDPDVFGEQLDEPGYESVERIAAVVLTVTRT